MRKTVGGGTKKVLYTLETVRKIGLKDAARALKARNTCKACGLGMGGQRGGMTNEAGEFPSVCNKSIQAQSTDIQPPIPREVFDHSLDELRELTARELETLGRLATPLHKTHGEGRYRAIDWSSALTIAAERFSKATPERSFFYASGRSSNEAGFLLQLFARAWGTNNVNNCSYYCHQATSVGLETTVGTGTATVELDDLTGCDCIFVIGANPASNHPRFIHKLQACRERGGTVVVINPAREPGLVKFAVPKSAKSMLSGGTEIATHYLQPNIGGDVALLKGIAKAVLELDAADAGFIAEKTRGWDAFYRDLQSVDWETIEAASRVPRKDIRAVAEVYAASKRTVFAWGMGLTHHLTGSQNVEYVANLALLRGMVGKRFAGLLPLRGHSNVQGIGSIGVKPVLADEVLTRMEQTLRISLPKAPGYDTLAALDAASKGAIDAALIMGGNLYSATPNSTYAQEALERIGFKLFLTTTLNAGHVRGVDAGECLVLPVLARDEEPQSTTQESMFNYVRLSDGGIDRLDGPRSEVAVLSALASRVLPDSAAPFEEFGDHERIRETIARVVPGMEQLRDIGVAKKEFHVRGRLLHSPVFNTEDGRARFRTHQIPAQHNAEDDFDLRLATIRSEGQFNSIIYEETDSYRRNATRRSLLMSAQDMLERGLSDGDHVDVESRNGHMRGLTVRQFDVVRGSVLAYYPEANVLTSTDRDPRSHTPAFKHIPVRVRAA